MQPTRHPLKDGQVLTIREAEAVDAPALLDYLELVSGESDYLTYGPGEFGLSESEEAEYLLRCRQSEGQIYLVGLVEEAIVATANVTTGRRARMRHCGEFGLAVRQPYWGLGIGSAMLDALIDWARGTGFVTQIDLRVRTDNQRAVALYQREGFVIEGTLRRQVYLGGRYYDHYWMGLEL